MAYAHRSAVDEVNLGMVEGSYKLVSKDRGGQVDPATYRARADLFGVWYGLNEAAVKEAPDALPVVTPNTVAVRPADPQAV